MNDKEEKDLIQGAKKTIVNWLVLFFLGSCVGLTAFYFSTTYITAQNSNDIQELKLDVKEISKTGQAPAFNTLKINQLRKEVADNKEQTKIILTDLKAFQKQYDEDQKDLFKLLLEIKNK